MSAALKMDTPESYQHLIDKELRDKADWTRVAICDGNQPTEILKMAIENGYSHVCQTSHPYFAHDLNTSALMLSKEETFVKFPVSSILTPGQASSAKEQSLTVVEMEFERAGQKSEILKLIGEGLEKTQSSNTIRSDVVVIADELSTNAIFNAPFVDLANTLPGAARSDLSTSMSQGKSAKVFLGADETRLVIGCRDPYGTLNIEKMFKRVKSCYDTSVAENMNMSGRGGAGIGSFMVFNSAASYYVAVAEGQYTIVCCVLPLKMSSRARQELPKNLHYIKVK